MVFYELNFTKINLERHNDCKKELFFEKKIMLATNQNKNNSSIANEPDPKVIEAFYSLYHSKEFKIFEIKIKELINYYPFSINLMNIYSLFLNEQKRYSEAVLLLERIIKIQPSNYRSIFDLGICCSITGNVEKALKCFQNLLQNNYKTNIVIDQLNILIKILSNEEIKKNKFLIIKALNLIINLKKFDHEDVWRVFNIVFSKIELKQLVKNESNNFFNSNLNKFLSESLFLNSLKSFSLKDSDIEKSLIEIRFQLLSLAYTQKELPNKKFIFSLAHQCFLNEYCYISSEREDEIVDELIKDIDYENINEVSLSILACYKPLYKILNNTEVFSDYKAVNLEFSNLINLQINERNIEKSLSSNLKVLGKIQDPVSLKVKNHYEENPYPRWSVSSLPQKALFIEDVINNDLQGEFPMNKLNSKKIELLVAGCGTGKQVVDAFRYGDVNITAVDLSATSLTYGMRKCNELGINNVQFIQSDILNLIKLNKKFDVIECSGVLHHMSSPNDGLRVLKNILKPGGYLKLGLYSELARKFVVKMKEYIKIKNYSDTPEDMKKFRNDIFNHQENNISNDIVTKLFLSNCFWNLSGVRDLIFHKQEYRYCIDELMEIFNLFNFEFLGFVIQKDILDYFTEKFPNDKYKSNLKNWDYLEKNHPEIFGGMYQFWLKNND